MGPGYAIFGISMMAVGMLSIISMIISNDAYGPIVDNARRLAEMGELGKETIRIADDTPITGFDVMEHTVFFGILIGASIPAVFSAMLILGIDKNAQRMVAEIHRQFNEIKGLREGKPGVTPEYSKCIDIATTGALKELIPAGLMSILATILVGLIDGAKAVGRCIRSGRMVLKDNNSCKIL